MSDQTTLVVTAVPNPSEMEAMQAYLQGVTPLLMAAGGTLVKRVKVSQVVTGEPTGLVMAMDFATAGAVTTVFASDEYAALLPFRDRGFASINIWLAQDM
jgi:uncharacterized protein (DUF1330 family)